MGQEARMIEFSGVNKWFGPLYVLNDISLTVGKGEVVVVCGPSGSGKSTLIRCVNGLEPFQQGRLVVDGTDLLAHNAVTAEFDLNARLANNMGCSVAAVIGAHESGRVKDVLNAIDVTRTELLLVLIAGLFVLITVSVILQVGWFKLSGGKRIFKMAPLQHHFELKGWQEVTIVVRFWIIAGLFTAIALAVFYGEWLSLNGAGQ